MTERCRFCDRPITLRGDRWIAELEPGEQHDRILWCYLPPDFTSHQPQPHSEEAGQ